MKPTAVGSAPRPVVAGTHGGQAVDPRRIGAAALRPLLSAPVKGITAWALMRMLDEYGDEQLVLLQRLAERGMIDSASVYEVRQTWAEIREAGRQWLEWVQQSRSSAHSAARAAAAQERPAPSDMDTAAAARLLRVSTSRIRQLVRSGQLRARKVGRVWLVSAASVEALREVQ